MITELLKKLARVFWLLPGFVLWASYPPMAERTDCVFALAPLMWLSRNADAKTNAKRWFANGFLFWFATLSWMPAIVKNGGPWPLVVLGWGALAAYCALYFGAYGWLSAKVWGWVRDEGTSWRKPPRFPYARRLAAILVAEPVLWCGLELVRSRFGGGFAWNQLGVPVVNAGFGAPAALGGVYLVSAVVVLINGTIAGVAERMLEPFRRAKGLPVIQVPKWARSFETLVPIALIWGLYVWGDWAGPYGYRQDRENDRLQPLRVAMIQRNFPCVFKPAEREDPFEVYSNLLANVSYTQPELVVLPESAMCEFGAVDSPRTRLFASWARRLTGARAVLAGAGRWTSGREFNSAGLYSADGLEIYDKVHLVPFGEFIPGDKLIPILQKLAPVGSCTPGELKLLPLSTSTFDLDLNLGVAICYEDTDSAQMRALARKGAKALVFITNDSWFSHSIEAEQHAEQAVARAIETGLPVVRVGNSGVTGTITPEGKASWLLGSDGHPLVDARATMADRIEVTRACCPRGTPYVLFGDIPLGVAFGLLLIAMILVKYKDNHEKRRYLSM